MDIAAEQKIAAPRERVYEALNDPDILRQCITLFPYTTLFRSAFPVASRWKKSRIPR
jgi:uncharacterized protein YndB with AHSA1/START domain